MLELKVGQEVPAWTYYACDGCGTIYPVTRTSAKTICESDLLCVACYGESRSADLADRLADLQKDNEELKHALEWNSGVALTIIGYCIEGVKCKTASEIYKGYRERIIQNMEVLAKHNKE